MKYLSLILFAFSLLLTSCNHSDEPPMTINLPIREQFVPCNLAFKKSDTELAQQLRPWYKMRLIVNSKSELPEDPFGFAESFYRINYSDNTLLLYYDIAQYNIVSYSNLYYKNTVENTYNWSMNLGISGLLNEDDEVENLVLSRYAILVPKLPADADVVMWQSLVDHNWDWSE